MENDHFLFLYITRAVLSVTFFLYDSKMQKSGSIFLFFFAQWIFINACSRTGLSCLFFFPFFLSFTVVFQMWNSSQKVLPISGVHRCCPSAVMGQGIEKQKRATVPCKFWISSTMYVTFDLTKLASHHITDEKNRIWNDSDFTKLKIVKESVIGLAL